MQMQYELTTPCTAADLAPLKAGDTVLLSGVVYTARDQAHKRMLEALDKGEKLPFDLEGSAIYYVGPTPERPGEVIGSAGPTTSGRMDAMSPRLLDLGNKIMIGKGKRDAAVKEAVVRSGAVYLAALGGAGALMARSVKTLEVIAWPDLGCEAAGYHNQAAEIGDALIEQTADNDHVGRIYRPDHFTLIDRFNVINLYSHIGRRMRTFHFYSFNTFHTNGRTFADADIHLAVGKFCKRIQSRLKINFLSFHDEIEVRS